jgi:hypothetical protein
MKLTTKKTDTPALIDDAAPAASSMILRCVQTDYVVFI